MKNKLKIYPLILLFFAIGCKKYEEGPLISFRTKQHRLEGKWQLEVNGTWYIRRDMVTCKNGGFVDPADDKYKKDSETWEFTEDKLNISTVWTYLYVDEFRTRDECKLFYLPEFQQTNNSSATWEFDDKKENVIITNSSGAKSYEIIELREKEMKLKLTEKGDVTTYTFKTLD